MTKDRALKRRDKTKLFNPLNCYWVDMKVKMTSRKVGFQWNEKNVNAFIDGFRFECEKQRFVEGINLASDFCLEPIMILKLRFCKEIYDQQREIGLLTASFSQGVAAAFYMINSRDDNESDTD